MAKIWKKRSGKLGVFQPLFGEWVATAETPTGPVRCTRCFEPVLGGAFVELRTRWEFERKADLPPGGARPLAKPSSRGTVYEERALIGVDTLGHVCFWSFTSDGKRTEGTLTDVTDLHPEALGFEAQMPAGHERMVYWPSSDGGYTWAIESRTANGWRRFMEHQYHPAESVAR